MYEKYIKLCGGISTGVARASSPLSLLIAARARTLSRAANLNNRAERDYTLVFTCVCVLGPFKCYLCTPLSREGGGGWGHCCCCCWCFHRAVRLIRKSGDLSLSFTCGLSLLVARGARANWLPLRNLFAPETARQQKVKCMHVSFFFLYI